MAEQTRTKDDPEVWQPDRVDRQVAAMMADQAPYWEKLAKQRADAEAEAILNVFRAKTPRAVLDALLGLVSDSLRREVEKRWAALEAQAREAASA